MGVVGKPSQEDCKGGEQAAKGGVAVEGQRNLHADSGDHVCNDVENDMQ